MSVQAQIINLLCDLKERRGLIYAFISHDLNAVRFISDEVAVMYLGKVVEKAPRKGLFSNLRHPYTIALLPSVPVFNTQEEGRRTNPVGRRHSVSFRPAVRLPVSHALSARDGGMRRA